MDIASGDDWRPSVVDWKPIENPDSHLPFRTQSLPVFLPANANSPVHLRTFDAKSCVGDSLPVDQMSSCNELHDFVLNVGGPVWALDWCPEVVPVQKNTSDTPSTSSGINKNIKNEEKDTMLYLAVGCHPHACRPHIIGEPIVGPNCIQIWEIAGLDAKKSSDKVPVPSMVLGIAHDGGLTWQCRWCPVRGGTPESGRDGKTAEFPRLGLLAAALGDGSVRVWSIPQPRAVKQTYNGERNEGQSQSPSTNPHVASPAPVAQLQARKHLGGSLPSRVDWLPDSPHDLLLIGGWDGSVAIVKLLPDNIIGNQDSDGPLCMRVLMHFPADSQPLRAARWLPNGMGTRTLDLANRYLFMTAGHEGIVKIWDARDQFRPAFSSLLTTATILDAAWTSNPLGVIAAIEDGSVRGVLLEAATIHDQLTPGSKPTVMLTWRGTNAGAIWSLGVDSDGARVAYAGEDGVVGLMRAEMKWDKRKRKVAHVPIAGATVDGNVVHVLSQDVLEEQGNGGLFEEKVVDRKEALTATKGSIPDAGQAVQVVAWSTAWPPSGASWLASGLGAGLVRCQWVQKDT